MLNENHHDDAIIDRNLELIGRTMSLPEDPSRQQVDRWMHAGMPVGPSRRIRGAIPMNRQRWLTLSGVGSALAAAVALGVFFGTPSHRSRVKADTIFAGLRDALASAFQVTFHNVVQDGVRSDGTMIVLNSNASSSTSANQSTGIYMEAHLQGEVGSSNADLDANATLCFMGSEHDWAYVRAQNVPQAMRTQNPLIGWLASVAANGVLIDLPSGGAEATQPAPPAADEDANSTTTLSNTTAGGVTTIVTESTRTTTTMRPGMSFSIGIGNIGSNGMSDADRQRLIDDAVRQAMQNPSENGNRASSGGSFSIRVVGDDQPMGALLNRLLTGQATQADFTQLATQLQASAGNVDIQETEPGLHVLTAADLHDATSNAASSGIPAGTGLQIAYRDGQGVVWAEVQHIGPADGTVRFERANVQPGDPRFDKQRYASDANVRQINLSEWSSLFGDLFSNSQQSPQTP